MTQWYNVSSSPNLIFWSNKIWGKILKKVLHSLTVKGSYWLSTSHQNLHQPVSNNNDWSGVVWCEQQLCWVWLICETVWNMKLEKVFSISHLTLWGNYWPARWQVQITAYLLRERPLLHRLKTCNSWDNHFATDHSSTVRCLKTNSGSIIGRLHNMIELDYWQRKVQCEAKNGENISKRRLISPK